MSCKLDPNSAYATTIAAFCPAAFEATKKHVSENSALYIGSGLSSIYAATGFPFDVKTVNRQAGKELSIYDCIFSRGLFFTGATAFAREFVGIRTASSVRSRIQSYTDEHFWENHQKTINFIAGSSRALCDAFIGNPVIIAKQMLFLGKAFTGREALKLRYEEEKSIIKAFYKKTFPLTAFRNSLHSGLQLTCFAMITRPADSKLQQALIGGAIGVGIGLLTFPIDRTRNLLIHDKTLLSTKEAIRSIYRAQGIRGFYSGYTATVCKMCASGIVSTFGLRAILEQNKK